MINRQREKGMPGAHHFGTLPHDIPPMAEKKFDEKVCH
jgi:hypothetical protein